MKPKTAVVGAELCLRNSTRLWAAAFQMPVRFVDFELQGVRLDDAHRHVAVDDSVRGLDHKQPELVSMVCRSQHDALDDQSVP
eukprot:3752484-Rhodomonas_salina.2